LRSWGTIYREDSEIEEAESEENEASERKRWNPIVRTGKPKGPRWRKNCFRKKTKGPCEEEGLPLSFRLLAADGFGRPQSKQSLQNDAKKKSEGTLDTNR
jgi:hypothetical protein